MFTLLSSARPLRICLFIQFLSRCKLSPILSSENVNIDKQYIINRMDGFRIYTKISGSKPTFHTMSYAVQESRRKICPFLNVSLFGEKCIATTGVWILPHKIVITGTNSTLDLIFNLLYVHTCKNIQSYLSLMYFNNLISRLNFDWRFVAKCLFLLLR